jgi:1-acyl-sn-glycerol-3-phosphate acyltransferase
MPPRGLGRRTLRPVIYAAVYHLAMLILRVCFRVEVEGRENIPEGGCIVVSNHLSWTDTAFILFALPKEPPIWTMANESTVFNTGWKRWLMPRLRVFPIRRNRGMLDETAVERVYDLLESGQRVMIFPEGAYGRAGQLRPLRDGIGYFALNSGKPLLPIALAGTNRLRFRGRVRVVIGPPFIPRPPVLPDLKARVRDAVAMVGDRLRRLGTSPHPTSSRGAGGGTGRRRFLLFGRRGGGARSSAGEEAAGVEARDAGVEEHEPGRE